MLLQEECVEAVWTVDDWRVDLQRYGWRNTMREAEGLQKEFEKLNK